jgi:AcrR family transcriptional regulator
VTATGQRAHPRGEARDAILTAARGLFAGSGYHGTSMRDIAAQASVSEALLYRYFNSKTTLFEEAVIEPYRTFVAEFLATWEHLDTQLSNDEMVSRFVKGLYAFMIEHRDLLFALVAANRFGEGDIDETGALSNEVTRLAEFTASQAQARGLTHVDLYMAASNTVAMILATALLDDLLFPADNGPDRDRIIEQLCLYAAAGVQQRPQ